ncbi:MAG: peptide-methionine (S)-S-oxide reductase, partial [Candidatus Bipolaricaulota bacterium]
IDFDPALVSYEEILEVFWSHHDCSREPRTPQYRSVIFYHTEEQRLAAEASWEAEGIKKNATPETEIVTFEAFTRAEDFHQKYWLLGSELVYELRDRFDSFLEFVDSTVAARLNGYVAGWGTLERLEADLPAFDLSEEGEQLLLDIFR